MTVSQSTIPLDESSKTEQQILNPLPSITNLATDSSSLVGLRGGLEPQIDPPSQRTIIRNIKRTIPLEVELAHTLRYQILVEYGAFDLYILKVFVPENKEPALQKWKSQFEKQYGIHILLDRTDIRSGMNEQLREWANEDKLLTNKSIEQIDSTLQSYFGGAPKLNGHQKEALRNISNLRDCTNVPFVAIDPTRTRDREDAIFARKIPGTEQVEIQVAFIDVTTFITPGDKFDEYAQRLGQTIYGSKVSIPTLGKEAAYSVANFAENQPRAAFVVKMVLDKTGVKSSEIERCKIKSHRNISPDEVNWLSSKSDEIGETLRALKLGSSYLHDLRAKTKGMFRIESDDEYADVIAECMIASKSELAKHAASAKMPIIYRVHTPPTEEVKLNLAHRISACGINITPDYFDNPRGLAFVMRELESHQHKKLLREVIDIFLVRSFFDTKNHGHFGVGSNAYLEIKPREASGLANQFQIRALLDTTFMPLSEEELARRALRRNRQREEQDAIEFRMRFLERIKESLNWRGSRFRGTVVEIHDGVAFVDIPEFTRWGIIPLRGRRFGRVSPGDRVNVMLEGFNVEKMRFQFCK